MLQAVDNLHYAAEVSRTGATEIAGAQQRTLDAIAAARSAGFTVSDDLTVSDTKTKRATGEHLARQNQARKLAHGIWSSAMGLAETDRSVAGRLAPTAAGFHGLTFREGPLPPMPPRPLEPPPVPVPFDEYIPKVWGACGRSADPNKEVRTFNRAALSAGYNYLPGFVCGKLALCRGLRDLRHARISRNSYLPAAQRHVRGHPDHAHRGVSGDTPLWQVNVVVSASDGKIVTA